MFLKVEVKVELLYQKMPESVYSIKLNWIYK